MAPQRRIFGYLICSVGSSDPLEGNSEMDRVMKRRYGEVCSKDKGISIACDCSAVIHLATCHSPNRRGERYISCPYEISDGPGQGCGFKRWWEPALLDEFDNIREEKTAMKKSLDQANGKIEELELRFEALMEDNDAMEQYVADANGKLDVMMRQYEELHAKFEWTEAKYEKLNKLRMSNISGSSIGNSSNSRRVIVAGIPKTCMCGDVVIEKISRSTYNPYRRYYHCSYAVENKLINDSHVFKWCDKEIVNELERMEFEINVPEDEVSKINASRIRNDGQEFAMMKTNLEMEVFEKMEEELEKMNKTVKKMMGIVFSGMLMIVVLGLMVKSKV